MTTHEEDDIVEGCAGLSIKAAMHPFSVEFLAGHNKSAYTTYHPNPGALHPIIKQTQNSEYHEHLLDGLCIMHNPFAEVP